MTAFTRSELFSGHRPAGTLLRAFALGLLVFAPHVVRAGDLVRAHFFTSPERIFVGQAFVLHFEVEATAGTELNDLQVSGLPSDPDVISVGRLENAAQNRITRGSQDLTVYHYTATARCFKPIEQTFSPVLQCLLVERRSIGFFTQMQSYSKRFEAEPFALRIQPLPVAGRPDAFSGAVGQFRLSGTLSASRVHPGDIITLTLDLSGQGWLGNIAAPAPNVAPTFKVYPPKELLREPLHLKTEQVLIPTSTNAAEIASVRFNFFNPTTGRYEETSAGPFPLTFTSEAAPKAEEVRVINTADTAVSASPVGALMGKRAELPFRQVLPLVSLCTAGVIGLWLFFMLLGRHTRAAFVAAACVFALGIAASRSLGDRASADVQKTGCRADARLAPSKGAPILFSLTPGASVTPLETAGLWTRIESDGRRGWIPNTAFAEQAKAKPAPSGKP